MHDHTRLRDNFSFTSMSQVSANGIICGLVVLWNEDRINVQEMRISEQEIHCLVQVCTNKPKWILSSIYASNYYNLCNILWNSLKNLHDTVNMPWLIGGFNEVLEARENLRAFLLTTIELIILVVALIVVI